MIRLKKQWEAFRRLPPGERFKFRYREEQRSLLGKSGWKRALSLMLVPLSFAIGVVLMFIPGPAILFFLLAGALLSSHVLWAARALDWAELRLRSAAKTARTWWTRSSFVEKIPVFLAALMVVLGSGFAALELFMSAR